VRNERGSTFLFLLALNGDAGLLPRLGFVRCANCSKIQTQLLLPLFQLSFFCDSRQRKLKLYRFRQRENWKASFVRWNERRTRNNWEAPIQGRAQEESRAENGTVTRGRRGENDEQAATQRHRSSTLSSNESTVKALGPVGLVAAAA